MQNDRFWELLARKIAGEASERELLELEQALKTHPHLHFPLNTFSDLWQPNNQKSIENQEVEKAWEKHAARMKEMGHLVGQQELPPSFETVLIEGSRKSHRRIYYWAAAATLVLTLLGWWAWGPSSSTAENLALNNKKEPKSEVSTKYGSKTRIQLPDGTQVWLNAGSKLNYTNEYGKTLREVQLIGEGFFDVVKNPQMPFVIHTSAIDVKVLGTEFNVRSYPGDKTTETSLVRGSVEVIVRKRPNEKYILKPNEKLVVLNEDASPIRASMPRPKPVVEPIIAIRKLTYKEGDSISVETAWAYNKLSFVDEPFVEVAKKMERWYDVTFEFRNTGLEELRLQGSFINETLPVAMEALKYSFRFKYEIKGKKVIVY